MHQLRTAVRVIYLLCIIGMLLTLHPQSMDVVIGLFLYAALLQLVDSTEHATAQWILTVVALVLWFVLQRDISGLGAFLLLLPLILLLLLEQQKIRFYGLVGICTVIVFIAWWLAQQTVVALFLPLITLSAIVWIHWERDQKQILEEHLETLEAEGRSTLNRRASAQVHSKQLRELYTMEERNRISRDLHDSVGHKLSALRFQLGAIERIIDSDPQKAKAMAAQVSHYAEEGLQELRHVVHQLKPPQYAEQMLFIRLLDIAEDFEAMSGMQIQLTQSENQYLLTDAKQQLLLFAFQEFLSNASRHGQATQVNAALEYGAKFVVFHLKDNGIGAKAIRKNVGLKGLDERVNMINGSVSYTTAPDAGFETRIVLPKEDQ